MGGAKCAVVNPGSCSTKSKSSYAFHVCCVFRITPSSLPLPKKSAVIVLDGPFKGGGLLVAGNFRGHTKSIRGSRYNPGVCAVYCTQGEVCLKVISGVNIR